MTKPNCETVNLTENLEVMHENMKRYKHLNIHRQGWVGYIF